MASLIRSGATPSHSAQMQKMWKRAHERLQRGGMDSSSPQRTTANGAAVLSAASRRQASSSIAGEEDTSCSSESVMNTSADNGLVGAPDLEMPYPSLPLPTLSGSVSPGIPVAEPMSSGFTSPVAPPREARGDEVMNAALPSTPFCAKQNSSSDKHSIGSSEWLTSSYGVPLAHPMSERELEKRLRDTSMSQVDAWLTTVLDESLPPLPAFVRGAEPANRRTKRPISRTESSPIPINEQTSRPGGIQVGDAQTEDLQSRLPSASRTCSNKENLRPSTNDIPTSDEMGARHHSPGVPLPSHPLLTLAKRSNETPIKHNSSAKLSWTPSSPMRRLVPTDYTLSRLSETPQGYFSLPPRRKRLKTYISPVGHAHGPANIEVAEDEELVELSPNVTPFRKGKGPKKTRTASYFDTDILPESFPPSQPDERSADRHEGYGKRYPLSDHPDSENLTKSAAFIKEIRGLLFTGV
jgi:hypothetical protein